MCMAVMWMTTSPLFGDKYSNLYNRSSHNKLKMEGVHDEINGKLSEEKCIYN